MPDRGPSRLTVARSRRLRALSRLPGTPSRIARASFRLARSLVSHRRSPGSLRRPPLLRDAEVARAQPLEAAESRPAGAEDERVAEVELAARRLDPELDGVLRVAAAGVPRRPAARRAGPR